MKLITPASRMDMARAMGARNPVFSVYGFEQLRAGESWALHTDAGELVGVGGIVRFDHPAPPQVWLMLSEAAQKHMLLVVRALRLTFSSGAYDDLECQVLTKAGARIAALCGLKCSEKRPHSMEIWKYDKPAFTAQKGQ